MSFELRRQSNGTLALYHAGLRETMHPHLGPWEEATRLYVAGSGLEALLTGRAPRLPGTALPAAAKPDRRALRALARGTNRTGRPLAGGTSQDVVVFDVGLGGAANALAAIACRAALARSGRGVKHLTLVSFERDLEALAFVIDQADRLPYARDNLDALRSLLNSGQWAGPGVRWALRQGDFARCIRDEPCRADIVFFDPFSHRANPVMWSVPVLESVYRCRRPGSGQRLVTYSSAFSVRAAFLLAGYYVGDGVRLQGRPTTIAASDFADLAEPLDERWLQRWRKVRDPWPALTASERHPAIREALLAHPQWGQLASRRERGTSRRTREGSGVDALLIAPRGGALFGPRGGAIFGPRGGAIFGPRASARPARPARRPPARRRRPPHGAPRRTPR